MSNERWDPYIAEITSFPILTEVREAELARLMTTDGEVGKKAKKALLESNLRVVVSVAVRESEADQTYLDLIVPAGNIGLVRALETFDGWGEQSFSTFASECILEEIQKYKQEPELYISRARERGVLWGEVAEEWLRSEAAGELAGRTRPPGARTIFPPP